MQAVAERYGEVLDALHDGLMLIDADGRVQLFNTAALRIMPALQTSLRLAELYPALHAQLADEIVSAAAGEPVQLQRVFFRRDDAAFYLSLRMYSVGSDAVGRPSVLVVLHDETDAELSEAQRSASISELQTQLAVARRYQQALFTSDWEDAALSSRAYGLPAYELSGDFFEVSRAAERYLLVLGDVQSHGIEVAIKAITLQHLTRLNMNVTPVAAQMMDMLNGFVFSDQQGSFWSSCMFIGCYDPLTRQLFYSRAGVPEPLLLRNSGEVELLEVGDTPLGFFEEEQYRNGLARVEPGDRLLLYSDGVTDSYPPDQPEHYYGQDRLVRDYKALVAARPGQHCLEQMVECVQKHHNSSEFADDFTLAEVIFK